MGTRIDSARWARLGASHAQLRHESSSDASNTSNASSSSNRSYAPVRMIPDLPALDLIDAPEWGDPQWRAASLKLHAGTQTETSASLPPMPSSASSWPASNRQHPFPRHPAHAPHRSSEHAHAPHRSRLPAGYVPVGQPRPAPWSPRVWEAWESHSVARSRDQWDTRYDGANLGIDGLAAYEESEPDFDGDDLGEDVADIYEQLPWTNERGAPAHSVYTEVRRTPSAKPWREDDASLAARLAAFGAWLLCFFTHRPVIWFPEVLAGRVAIEERRLRLPPVWLLFNLSAVLLILLGLLPSLTKPARAEACGWYAVHSGDTIEAISAQYHVPMQVIISRNTLMTPPQLLVGEQLCLPTGNMRDTVLAPIPHSAAAQPTVAASASSTSSAPKSVSGEAAFVAFALPYAKQAHAALGWPTSVILAQWGLEHGWKLPGFTGFNFGNVAALPGEQTTAGTQAWGSPAAFSYAPTPAAGLREYIHVAQLGYYSGVAAAAHSGADAAAAALGQSPWDAGHYTGDGNPGDSLINIMRSFNLYQYD